MSYAQFDKIQASDVTSLIGISPGTGSNFLNTVWAVGGSAAGYGQTPLSSPAIGSTVSASTWSNITGTISNIGNHQGSSLQSMVTPAVGGKITYQSSIVYNLSTIYSNRLNAAAQGTFSPNLVTRTASWDRPLVFEHIITFNSSDSARYFFNSGGQLAITCSHPSTLNPIDQLFNQLAQNVGTLVFSAPSSGSAKIVGTTYTGFTKVGGGGITPIIYNTNYGYYAFTSSPTIVFEQYAVDGGYSDSSIFVNVSSTGPVGSNGGRGSTITIQTYWNLNQLTTVQGGTRVTLTVRPPSTTYLPAAAWGSYTVTGSVSIVYTG